MEETVNEHNEDHERVRKNHNKLGLSWAKLSPSWGLKLELKLRFDAEV